LGTKVIPHFGHLPGASEVTSGCIGQVYTVALALPLGIGIAPL
jgi:hypothetical protein